MKQNLYEDGAGMLHGVRTDNMGKTLFAWTICGKDIVDFFKSREKVTCDKCLEIDDVEIEVEQ